MACFVAGRIARVALRIKRKNFRCGEASVTRGNAWFLDDRTKPPVTELPSTVKRNNFQ